MEYISPEFEVKELGGLDVLSMTNETPLVPLF